MTARESILELQDRMNQSILGQEDVVNRLIMGLLANGNLLVEGLPGLAKTRAVKSLAKEMAADFSRIQFTPDLLPSDITGTEVYHQVDGRGEFRFEAGPIFANIVLADEINRAPAKVQAALLEAMEERQVTVAKTTHKMPDLFMVMATQNPVEQEGTYPLPEAQMDRFLMHINMDYPDKDSEVAVVRLVRGESSSSGAASQKDVIPQQAVFEARTEIDAIHVADAVDRYIVDLVDASRHAEKFGEDVGKWIQIGASPRGAIGLDKCSRVNAWMEGRDHTTPDDVRAVVHDVFRHRIMLSYEANAEGVTADEAIRALVEKVAVA